MIVEGGRFALASLRCPASLESRGSASCLARSAGKRSAGPFSIPLRPCALATLVHPCTSGFRTLKGSNTFRTLPLPKPGVSTPGLGNGGEGGIRTLGTLLAYTHFPGVLLKPLGHLSGDNAWRHAPKRDARVNYRLLLRNKAIRQRGKVRPNHRAAPRPRTPAGSAGMPPHSCDYRSGRRQHSDALNRVRGP